MPESAQEIVAQLSSGLQDAVARAGQFTVLVNARRRQPASGIVWSADGLILAAAHTIERDEGIEIGLPNDERIAVTLVGRDPGSDLALLRATDVELVAAPRADAGAIAVGALVLSVARPGPRGPVAALGIVSDVGGTWRAGRGNAIEGFLRTDSTMYPGFSGGPLVDIVGEALAMNTSRYASGGGGFAVPLSAAEPVVEALLARGYVSRAFLGIASQPTALPDTLAVKVSGQGEALLVVHVDEEGPAAKAGLLIGDLLVTVGAQPVRDTDDLLALLGPQRIGVPTALTVLRGGAVLELSIEPTERPA